MCRAQSLAHQKVSTMLNIGNPRLFKGALHTRVRAAAVLEADAYISRGASAGYRCACASLSVCQDARRCANLRLRQHCRRRRQRAMHPFVTYTHTSLPFVACLPSFYGTRPYLLWSLPNFTSWAGCERVSHCQVRCPATRDELQHMAVAGRRGRFGSRRHPRRRRAQ